jgi:hypothetical protein
MLQAGQERDAKLIDSTQVGVVCWPLAGWDQSAGFELALGDRADFGRSRFSASQGLDTLERAGLVSVSGKPGRSPGVTMWEATASDR